MGFLLEDKQNTIINEQINRSSPSDYVSLTDEEARWLVHLWNNGSGKIGAIPSDLFFSNTIPVKDIVINWGSHTHRCIVFDEYVKELQSSNTQWPVGAMVWEDGKIIVFFAKAGFDYCHAIALGWKSGVASRKNCSDLLSRINTRDLIKLFYMHWAIWYGIQIALLHPALKEVFNTPQRTPYEGGANFNKYHKKRRVKYIRKHYITLGKLQKALETQNEGRKINRKCLAWYVIGHWRTYKSGKKVFVQGFWKGVLRDTKRNADGDDRERIIDTAERVGAS